MCKSEKTKNASYYYCPNCKCEVTPNYHEYCDFCGSSVITVDTYSPEECKRAFELLDLVNSGKVKLFTAKDEAKSDVISCEYSEEFDRLRKNRMEVSFFKYGSARDNYGGGRVDAIQTLELCVKSLKKQGIQNTWLTQQIMQCFDLCILYRENILNQHPARKAPA